MGGLTEAQVSASVEAVARRAGRVAMAEAVGSRRTCIDALEVEIENRCIRLVALRQPLADDLRQTLSAIKIAGNLERCGDLAKSIAKRGLVLNEAEPIIPLTRSIERLGRLVAARLKDVLDAYANGDLDRAVAVWSRDQEVDEHYNSLFRELLTYMMGDPRMITPCAHLLFIAKNLELIGDHATKNIAEIVYYQLERRKPEPTFPAEVEWRFREQPPHPGGRGRRRPWPSCGKGIILDKEGYRVAVANDGEEAMIQADEETPDLVVLDWMLPRLSGIEVCRRLRSGRKTRNVLIDHHADRPRRRDRPSAGPGRYRGRRLYRQAGVDERTGRPGSGRAAPGSTWPSRGRSASRRYPAGPRRPPSEAGRA